MPETGHDRVRDFATMRIKKALWRTTGPQVSGRNRQLARFQVWPPQNMPPKAQPWTLSVSVLFSAIVES